MAQLANLIDVLMGFPIINLLCPEQGEQKAAPRGIHLSMPEIVFLIKTVPYPVALATEK